VKDLPAQNDVAPVAQTHSPLHDPAGRYWLGWLRPVLWVCVAVGLGWMPTAVTQIGSVLAAVGQRRISIDDVVSSRISSYLAFNSMMATSVLPLILLVGAAGALRLKAWSRTVLFVFVYLSLVNSLAMVPLRLMEPHYLSLAEVWVVVVPLTLGSFVQGLALPGILWLLLRRTEIAALFTPVTTGSAFQPVTDQAVSNPTAA
jgi:hypothetical protein